MIEDGRVIGLGAAYVDAKIQSSELILPPHRNQLPGFLDDHPEATLYPGGSISNIMTAFVRLSTDLTHARLISCVGDDSRGKFFAEHTDNRLGEPQVSTRNPTGVWVGIYDRTELLEDLDFYGAAADINVSREELHDARNEVFITDIDACRVSESDAVKQVLDVTEDNGLFILSLSGLHHGIDIQQLLSFTNRIPNVIFGNATELSYITHQAEIIETVKTFFPESRLVVITQAEKGALIKFGEHTFSIPATYISQDRVIDATGAGDAFMGTMLALLLRNKYRNWSEYGVMNAARVAAYASSLVIQSMQSRLTSGMAQSVLEYVRGRRLIEPSKD